ncbi:helix-turn-helix domain-containing protein [Lactobacillus taiwanensis]|uniref:helix-turn-helix domain-containing protein n=1 Tax=Lactobacillus taiwanensis TaxID=508451 RepID=UPI00214B031C|nr:Rgg/GadR/MutR family transcriptional regulator [Lactobacillus taiwanensis]MCR1916353.1 helix-turn-helix domain-containing protein [Lactobacillus taiwanensis]
MTIGEALKAERKRLGLSQSQMTGNLITKSHYSKIERGLFDIRTNDLLTILNLHNIDMVEFFKKISVTNQEENTKAYLAQLHAAYYTRNIKKIEQTSSKLKNKQLQTPELKNLEAQASLLKAYLTNSINTLSDKSKENIKKIIFSNDEWQLEDLRLFAIAISLFDISELNSVVKSIINRHLNLNLEEKEYRLVLSSILVNFLSYSVKVQNSDTQLIKKVFQVLDNLNGEPDNCFAKIMTLYYREYFTGNKEKIDEIIGVMKDSGMKGIFKNKK